MGSDGTPTSYDVVPYASTAFPQSHPDRLATLARLFGIAAAPPDRCRVLELGAASGGNLIPMAYELPHSQFVGVDLSSRQVADGQATINALGLANIQLRQLSITDIGSDFGQFDYIICHGVYSWVPDAVRDGILSVCSNHLAPDGVAFVSYNTYPGWHMRGMIRDMMRYHAGRFDEPRGQIEQARSLLNFLATNVAVDTPYGMLLRSELDGLQRQPDSYLFHEHLEEVNNPLYFFQFAEQLDRHGLQYLAEADFSTMLPANFSPNVAEVLQRIAPDIIHTEQYLDFLRNRTFRQTLLVHRSQLLRRSITADRIKPFCLASPARPVAAAPDLRGGAPEEFRTSNGLTLKTAHPLTKAAMAVMAEHWPEPLHFEQLCAAACSRQQPDDPQPADDSAVQLLAGELLSAYTAGMLELRPRQLSFTRQIDPRPVASRVARVQAGSNVKNRVVNLRHEPVMLDELKRQVLLRLDGEHDREDLVDELLALVQAGALNVHRDGTRVVDGAALRPLLANLVDNALSSLAATCFLERQAPA